MYIVYSHAHCIMHVHVHVHVLYIGCPGEGMQKLVTMIRAQHQAWNERLAARASLLQSSTSHVEDTVSSPPSASHLHPPPPPHRHGGGVATDQGPPTAPATVAQQDSLSIYTLSTRYMYMKMSFSVHTHMYMLTKSTCDISTEPP